VWHSRSGPHTGLFYHAHTCVGVAGVLVVVPRKSCHVSLVTLESSGVIHLRRSRASAVPGGRAAITLSMRALQLLVTGCVTLRCAAETSQPPKTSAAARPAQPTVDFSNRRTDPPEATEWTRYDNNDIESPAAVFPRASAGGKALIALMGRNRADPGPRLFAERLCRRGEDPRHPEGFREIPGYAEVHRLDRTGLC
jgi:hypothetical protein